MFLIKSLRCESILRLCRQGAVSRTCTCALEVAALVKEIGEEGPWEDIPVRRYTVSWVHAKLPIAGALQADKKRLEKKKMHKDKKNARKKVGKADW